MTKNCENAPEREVKSQTRIIEDQEELKTFAQMAFNSLEIGEKIDAQLRKVFVGGLPHNLTHYEF